VSEQVVLDVVIGIVVLAALIYRQLRTRPVRSTSARLMLVLAVVGVVQTVGFLQKHHLSAWIIGALAGSLVLALIFGALRAMTVKIWMQNGVAMCRGNWLTAGLWILAVAAHLGYDYLLDSHHGTSGLGNATIVLYLAVTFAVQRLIQEQRASKLDAGGGASPFFGQGPVSGAGA
jgi:hypothetical protein